MLQSQPVQVCTIVIDVTPTYSLLDAKFEVLGGPYSLLSVSLSASQNLYTRRGTLIAVGGKAENVSSTAYTKEQAYFRVQ